MATLIIAVCPQLSHHYFGIIGASINTVIKLVIFSYSCKNELDHTNSLKVPLICLRFCGTHLEKPLECIDLNVYYDLWVFSYGFLFLSFS